ncbi:metallophosphatase [Mangrovimonas futianensis]|uniref:metallophosphatase n=1 Tax=Mangrovimonas futianensis TaxID=2895523 RepID=UPI001E2F53B3|nr:metallophosphatase [Mangrovimonas futianensis]MCF1422938.1 metallophosphatase [Mangrovimonas futianensis]
MVNIFTFLQSLLNTHKIYFPFCLILIFSFTHSHAQEGVRKISQVFYFTGNTGVDESHYTQEVLSAISQMSQADDKATFVAIGNITGKNGFPPKKKARKRAEELLQKTLMEPMQNFNGRVIYTPGKNEWNKNGHENIDDMESFIQDNSKAEFWPNDGCVREIEDLDTDNVELLMIDSQWFLEDWDEQLYINNKCDIKTREQFFSKFKDDLKDEQNKTVIVAIHHPILSNTRRGFLEKIGGVKKEDYYSQQRKKLRGALETMASMFPDVIFVSASDENLQYLSDDGIPQIISGTGGKKTRKAKADEEDGQFASHDHGFAKLTVYNDNSSEVAFYSVEKGTTQKVFSNIIRRQQTTMDEVSFHDISDWPATKKASIYTSEETSKSLLYNFFWGTHYREVYSKEVEVPVLDLSKLPGNPVAISEGGGNQSRSVRIKDEEDHEYTLRELRKSAVRFIQSVVTDHYVEDYMDNTVAERLVQDFYTTAHPYAPFALNPMLDTLNIYNAEPEIYYLPKQKNLNIFNEDYGDKLYMMETHAGDENKDNPKFGAPDDIVSTSDLLKDMSESKEYQIMESEWIKARLVDMLIGDWDRHSDQWRFSEFEQENDIKLYRPIRRDRDQAFPRYDGLLLKLLKLVIVDFRKMQDFEKGYKNIKWLNFDGYSLDQAFIKNLSWEDWNKQVELIQNRLSDQVIEDSFKVLPNAVQDQYTEDIKIALKKRRDELAEPARAYYEYLNRVQIITGTEDDDMFLITRLPEGKTKVSIESDDKLVFEHTYDKGLTKEIWLYGLDGKDEFQIVGEGDHLIKLKLMGGENNDTYNFENNRKAKLYDYKSKKNTIIGHSKKWLVDDYDINNYNSEKKKYTTNTVFPAIGWDPDAGFKVGFSDTFTTYGLANNPFKSQHTFGAAYFSATSGYEFTYSGEFAHVFHNWNFGIEAGFTSPNYAMNFFGYGNESAYDDNAVDKQYNRIGIAQWYVAPSLIYRNEHGMKFTIKPIVESHKVDYNAQEATGEFFNPENDVFESQMYAGGEISFQYKNKGNQLAFVRRGFQFDLATGYKTNIDEFNNEFLYLKPSLSIDYPIHESGIAVLATKIGSQMVFGDNYEFYHGATLGGNFSLRGYRNERFNGKTAFYQSTDLRVGIAKFRTNFIPIRMGVTAGFDYGRIWVEDDQSQVWHNNYGGSIFINGFNALSGNLGLYHGADGNRFTFSLGFTF